MHHEEHGGLQQDLAIITRMLERRRALQLFGAAAGFAALGGIGKLLTPVAALAGDRCVADAPETAGPYPADGTNQSQGPTNDVLTEAGVVRRDIRSSFIGSVARAKGVPVKLTMQVVNTHGGCAVLPGYAVYIWQCDRDALYSLYTIPKESYLRGVQVADEEGNLTFKTIFPACYPGRYPHMHLEIFESLEQATNGHNAVLTTQLALPADVCQDVYDKAKGYEASRSSFANISLETDSVFRDDTRRQLRAMTPEFKGSVKDGYTATCTLGVPV